MVIALVVVVTLAFGFTLGAATYEKTHGSPAQAMQQAAPAKASHTR